VYGVRDWDSTFFFIHLSTLLTRLYVEVGVLLTCAKTLVLNVCIISLRFDALVHKNNVIQSPFIEMSVPYTENERLCIFVLGYRFCISFCDFLSGLRTFPTVCYCFSFYYEAILLKKIIITIHKLQNIYEVTILLTI